MAIKEIMVWQYHWFVWAAWFWDGKTTYTIATKAKYPNQQTDNQNGRWFAGFRLQNISERLNFASNALWSQERNQAYKDQHPAGGSVGICKSMESKYGPHKNTDPPFSRKAHQCNPQRTRNDWLSTISGGASVPWGFGRMFKLQQLWSGVFLLHIWCIFDFCIFVKPSSGTDGVLIMSMNSKVLSFNTPCDQCLFSGSGDHHGLHNLTSEVFSWIFVLCTLDSAARFCVEVVY